MSLALARKYRPRTFGDVAVQSHVANTLRGAVARGRVAHGYLLCGPRGVGKTTLARVLAMALNCEHRQPDGEPCGTCTSCTRIWSGSSSLDVVEIDAASNRGVDDARELRERAMYAPSGEHGYKVYIVDEAHMLTREAWNALLKILEEPPPRVVFVFATTEPQKIAQAAAPVLSRLQRFDFKRMGAGDIRQRLEAILAAEQVEAEPEALLTIARAADGSMRDALSLTDQVLSMDDGAVTAARVREALGFVAEDEFIAVLDMVAERRAGDVFAFVARLADAGVDFGIFLTGLGDMLRAQLAVTLGGTAPDVSEAARRALAERAGRLAAGDLLRMLSALADLEPLYRQSAQQQMLIEMLLVRFALMDRTVELTALLGALGSGGGGAPADTPAAVRAKQVERPVPLPDPPRVLADASPSAAPRPVPVELARVAERWEELVERLRAADQRVVADALQNAVPASVSAANGGELVIAQRTPNPFHARAIQERSADVLAVLQGWFTGVARIALSSEPLTQAPKRETEEMRRRERLDGLRQRNPMLGAAIDVLDLDVAD